MIFVSICYFYSLYLIVLSNFTDMKGYAPYFPSSEKIGCQNNGQNFQYARDIQEDCGSTGDEHNTSFQGETIPGKSSLFNKSTKPMSLLITACCVTCLIAMVKLPNAFFK